MPTIKADPAKARDYVKHFDWSKSDALTDADIARQIAEDPDAAPLPADEPLLSDTPRRRAGGARIK